MSGSICFKNFYASCGTTCFITNWNRARPRVRIGKISWMWNAINTEIIKQLSSIPAENYRLVKLEEIDYRIYIKLHMFIGGRQAMSKNKFYTIINNKPAKGPSKREA